MELEFSIKMLILLFIILILARELPEVLAQAE